MDSNHIPPNPILLVSCLLALLTNVCVNLFVDLFVDASAFHHRGGTVSPLHPFARFNTGVLSSVQSVRARFSCFVTASPLLAGSLFVPMEGSLHTVKTGA